MKNTSLGMIRTRMKLGYVMILLPLICCGNLQAQQKSNNDLYDYTLVWSDEFDGSGAIDTTKWHHQTTIPNGASWYNGEIQHYTDRIENTFQDSGYLHIVAKKESYTDQGITKQFTSARLNSKFAFTYGKVEIRAQLPFGVGTWPALWMMGKNISEKGGYWYSQGYGTTGWPDCGEFDIMEHWGSSQNYVSSAIHTPSSYGGTINKGGRVVSNVSGEFHVYACEWTENYIRFTIDSIEHYTYYPSVQNDDTWPFYKDCYILMNIAILPNIAGTFIESPMIIDYVRVYQGTPPSSAKNELTQNMISYPNPFQDELTIEFESVPEENISISIYNNNGQLVSIAEVDSSAKKGILTDLGNLPKGTYFFSYQLDNSLHTIKAVKQ